MTLKHQIILSYTKDLSVETPDAESLISARENISNIILKGGFPPLFVSPIDFHTIYQNELDKRKDN